MERSAALVFFESLAPAEAFAAFRNEHVCQGCALWTPRQPGCERARVMVLVCECGKRSECPTNARGADHVRTHQEGAVL